MKPITFCILDGWGISEKSLKNAVKHAKTPNFSHLEKNFPSTQILASGNEVGLPKGQVGNSEVGHMNIGCGRVIKQDLLRIDEAFQSSFLDENNLIDDFASKVKINKGVAHIIALISDGGVHSKDEHILKISQSLAKRKIEVLIHAFTDGRDTLPNSALDNLVSFNDKLPNGVKIASVMGRYYPMDRDNRWERTFIAWETLMLGKAKHCYKNVKLLIQEAYSRGETDEFISPSLVEEDKIKKFEGMNNGDGLLIGNFRSDRVRQIISSLIDRDFEKFKREKFVNFSACIGMVPYSDKIDKILPSLFPKHKIKNSLGELVSNSGLRQLRIAETEKYPHVTFFFNGGNETAFQGEKRILIPSPKVATYDLQPEMSAEKVTDSLVNAIGANIDLIVVNYANPDMVGHTGNLEAAVKACEAVDAGLGHLMACVKEKNGCLVMTADHGNCEVMIDPETKLNHTAHTTHLVPFAIYGVNQNIELRKHGRLADVAPTVLCLMGLHQPREMTGKSMIEKKNCD